MIVTDPMLATGGSSCDALQMLKDRGCTNIKLMCLVAVPEGIAKVQAAQADIWPQSSLSEYPSRRSV